MAKMKTIAGKYIVEDNGREIVFDTSRDAWTYVFIIREMKKSPEVPKTLYPVRSLNPIPTRRCKTVVLQNG